MLKQRVLTAAVLGGIVLAIILSGSNLAFIALMGVCMVLGGWEWARLCGEQNRYIQSMYAALVMLATGLIIFTVPARGLESIVAAGVIWWVLASMMVCLYAAGRKIISQLHFLKYLMGFAVLLPFAISLAALYDRPDGPLWVIWLFILIWAVDSSAYFAGRRWGRRRLAQRVSPGKTWEGVAGGLCAAVIIALASAWMSHNTEVSTTIGLVMLFVVVTVFSVMGDLFESMFKRESNLKDSGQLLPGHGGLLDRIDSLTAAAPVYALGLWLLETR